MALLARVACLFLLCVVACHANTYGPGFMGCLTNDANGPLDGMVYRGIHQTVDLCITVCTGIEHKYAGLSDHEACQCGNNLKFRKYEPHLLAECNFPCTGNKEQMCGGNKKISIYRTK